METNMVSSNSGNDPLQLMEMETRHLRETIEALRNELEHHQFGKEEAVQKVTQNSAIPTPEVLSSNLSQDSLAMVIGDNYLML